MRIRGYLLRFLALAGVAASGIVSAQPREVDKCINAFETAQVERDQGKLLRARELLSACAENPCPTVIQQDCREWLFKLDERIPTVVLRARLPDGTDLADVAVSLDGKPLANKLDGRSIPVDPGVRRLSWSHSDYEPVQTEVIVREGEKNRFVSVVFEPGKADPSRPQRPDQTQPDEGGAVPTGAWVVGALGVGALGVSAVLGLSVSNRYNDLEDSCAPYCDQKESDRVRVDRLERDVRIVNVALGVGVVGVAVATVWALSSGPEKPATTDAQAVLDIRPTGRGAAVVYRGCF